VNTKMFEIRDRSTFIPVLAVNLWPKDERDLYLLSRAGYGSTPDRQGEYILLARIDGGNGKAACDPYDWADGARTLQVAHDYIIKNWNTLPNGAVVDVEYILGETKEPKVTEAAYVG
jgi:hypothetical protein